MPDVLRVLHASMPRGGLRFLEVGCAPGGWMAFFQKEFGYRVDGVEYVPEAAGLARRNLEMLGVEGEVICDDLFEMREAAKKYEVVFSGGFIEHFRDTNDVVARIADLTQDHVVTLVPNLFGINGAICKTVRPEVYDKHVLIDPETLREAHEKAGLTTQFCGYVGGLRLIKIAFGNRFFDRHYRLAASINRPVEYMNQVLRKINEWTGFPWSARWWSPSVLYVGRRVPADELATTGSVRDSA